IQNRDDECNIVKPFAFSEHWPPLYASTGSPTELDVAGKPSLFRLSTGNNRAMRPRWKSERMDGLCVSHGPGLAQRTSQCVQRMAAFGGKADIGRSQRNVRF